MYEMTKEVSKITLEQYEFNDMTDFDITNMNIIEDLKRLNCESFDD